MNRLGRLAQLVGLSTIPLAGVFWRDWSDATALAFYWCETVLVIVFVALRLILHRRRTNKRGHYVETQTLVNDRPVKKGSTTYNVSFLTTAAAFSFGNLVFLFAVAQIVLAFLATKASRQRAGRWRRARTRRA